MVMFWFVDDQCPHWLSTGDSSKSPPSTRPMEEESERKKRKRKDQAQCSWDHCHLNNNLERTLRPAFSGSSNEYSYQVHVEKY
jgi:hypothetical protein